MPNIEEHLRKAMDEGKFDNLPGKGKPIRLDETNPHADPEWELAYHMLKDAGYTLPWIETIREIETDIASARQDLKRAWDWQQTALSEHKPDAVIQAEWERALAAFNDTLTRLNKRIRDYNLEVPNSRFQRPILSFEYEVEKITTSGV